MQNPDQTPENNSQNTSPLKSGVNTNNFSATQMEIIKLENDLKYMTGKGDKQEALGKILRLKKEATESEEGEMIEVENEKNFESGMSFTESQESVINSFSLLVGKDYIKDTLKSVGINFPDLSLDIYKKSDLKIKKAIDVFVEKYRGKRNNFPASGYDSNYTELDNLVLSYEKAFGVNSIPLLNQALQKERFERVYRDSLNKKVDSLEKLKLALLEAKANARTSILGRIDTTLSSAIESQIKTLKQEMINDMTRYTRESFAIDLDTQDFTLS